MSLLNIESSSWRTPFALTLVATAANTLWFAYVTLFELGYFRGETRRPSPRGSSLRSAPPAAAASEPLISSSEFRPFIVQATEQITHNVKCITFALPDGRSLDLPVGRHLQVRVQHEGQPAMAYFTPVSTNAAKGFFCIVVKRYEGGKVSPKMHDLKPGGALEVRGPVGRFTYNANEYESVGMLAGGTGITPMLQLLKSSAGDPTDRTNMRLIFSNSTDNDIILEDELDLLAQAPRFHVHYTCSRPAPEWKKGSTGRISKEMIAAHLAPPSTKTIVLLCGPPAFVLTMKSMLEELGYSKPQVYVF